MQKQKKIVIKIGTKVLTSKDRSLDRERLRDIVGQVSDVQDGGARSIIVTSGAIGAGMWLLGMKRRPGSISELQAAASVGQGQLMHLYSEYLRSRGYSAGQILLTQEDFNDRTRYLNIKHTIGALLAHNAVPVINENDTVATDEIRCGDNDRLSAMVADLAGADMLVLLSDVDGLLDNQGNLIRFVDAITDDIAKLAGKSGSDLGTGGMATKIDAVMMASGAGIECVIASGREKNVIKRIVSGESVGTRFTVGHDMMFAKKRWIAFSSRPKGSICVDDGAGRALKANKSLLASGVTAVTGTFRAGDVVRIIDQKGSELARGIASHSSTEAVKIKGRKTSEFRGILGYGAKDEMVHKDNLVIL